MLVMLDLCSVTKRELDETRRGSDGWASGVRQAVAQVTQGAKNQKSRLPKLCCEGCKLAKHAAKGQRQRWSARLPVEATILQGSTACLTLVVVFGLSWNHALRLDFELCPRHSIRVHDFPMASDTRFIQLFHTGMQGLGFKGLRM